MNDRPIHLNVQSIVDEQCFGELKEVIEQPEGFPPRVYYVCSECGEEIKGSVVLNHDRDIPDWEYDYEYFN